jgi:CBS domain-containing protein
MINLLMPTEIKVRDIMLTRVVTGKPSEDVVSLARRMREEDVGSVVICEGNKPVGIVTREDVVTKVVAFDKDPKKLQAKDIMNAPLVACSPDDDILDAARVMAKYGYERLPVVAYNKLVGFISTREIAKASPLAIEVLRERLSITTEGATEESNSGYCELCGNYSEELSYVNGKWVCENCKDEAGEL